MATRAPKLLAGIAATALALAACSSPSVGGKAATAADRATEPTGPDNSNGPVDVAETLEPTASEPEPSTGPDPSEAADAVSPTEIPLGDGNVSTEPEVGSVWSCTDDFRTGGARHAGDWIDDENGTWDSVAKVEVQGEVWWPDADNSETADGATRVLTTNALPELHPTGTFPIARDDPAHAFDTNPNEIAARNLTWRVPMNPTSADDPGAPHWDRSG